MTRLRAMCSVKIPKTGAEIATARVVADTVRPTPVFEARNRCASIGSKGCVQ